MEIMMGYAMDFMKAFVYAAVAVGLTFLLKKRVGVQRNGDEPCKRF